MEEQNIAKESDDDAADQSLAGNFPFQPSSNETASVSCHDESFFETRNKVRGMRMIDGTCFDSPTPDSNKTDSTL
jgi:hypothetical protein